MNFWKPIALCSIAALVGVVGINVHASGSSVGVDTASAGGPCRDQPNMAAAKDHLAQARAALDRAEHNKAGWRDRAIGATDNAIRETNKGCEFADTH